MWEFVTTKTPYILLLLGSFTLVFVLAALFTSFTETHLEVRSTTPAPLGSAEFRSVLESITHTMPISPQSEIKIFGNGTLFLDDLVKEMDQATSSITMTNYIFEEGEMTERIIDTLEKKAKEGVEVRLLLDAIGSYNAPEAKLKELEEAGGKVVYFRPLRFRTITRIHRRTHVRAIVIDGVEAYSGGLAFSDEWLGDGKSEKNWKDLMFKYTGPMARVTQDQFNSLWRQTDGEILTGEKFYPTLSPVSESRDNYFVSLLHDPAPDLSADLLDLIWLTIEGAQDHIYLATPYLTPPPEIVEALTQAVARGVDVEILVPGPNTNSKVIQSATHSYYEKLLKAGVHIYEYQPGRFHEKFLTADNHWSLFGSANMDNRSATLNVENIFGVEDKVLAQKLVTEFQNDQKLSKEITQENFHPNIIKKLYYSLVSIFAKQF
jgi:cardiolipin synthase